MSAERYFLDTNVLVYLFDGDAPARQTRAREIFQTYGATGQLVISTQVLQEFYVTVTRKLAKPLAPEVAYRAVQNLTTLLVCQVTPELVLSAIQRSLGLRLSFWDALIVQAALESGAATLWSEDLQHGQIIDGLRIENPFR
ncbi:MAG: PIN domain-containing protein [Candidatus Competibacter sp.]|nr:PIN domain-containing protein [Candidatus Competibacter sp.]